MTLLTTIILRLFNKEGCSKVVLGQYILVKEKFPLGVNKFGVLVDKLNELLNPDSSMVIKGNIDFERIEATKEHVQSYKKEDQLNFIRSMGVPWFEICDETQKEKQRCVGSG